MTTISDDPLQAPQHEVQRLLGRCLLRLQQYERLIKTVVANHEISGPFHALEEIRAARTARTGRAMLGNMVGELLGSYLVAGDASDKASTAPVEETASFSMRFHISLPETEFARIERELKELVLLRNDLVHHFIDRNDIMSVEGCNSACEALRAAYNLIDHQFGQLCEWAEDMQKCRQQIKTLISSDAFHDLIVDGIAPDGTVDWPASGIVSALREAASELAVEGWTSIAEASRWIEERYPEQRPEKYGCSTWKQAVHESQVFEIKHIERDGQRFSGYREKDGSVRLN